MQRVTDKVEGEQCDASGSTRIVALLTCIYLYKKDASVHCRHVICIDSFSYELINDKGRKIIPILVSIFMLVISLNIPLLLTEIIIKSIMRLSICIFINVIKLTSVVKYRNFVILSILLITSITLVIDTNIDDTYTNFSENENNLTLSDHNSYTSHHIPNFDKNAQLITAVNDSYTFISIWNTTQPIAGSIAETYLKSRWLQTWSSDMRFHPSLYYADDRTERPTLVCAVRREGKIVGIHRTFLTDAGKKFGKKMLGPCGGGSVYVGGDGDVTAVAEGIENALSVRIMSGDHRARYFAALSATGMSKLKLPEDRGQLMIFADGDRTGMTAACELGERASLKGWNANTMIPPKDRDWNDELIAGLVGST